MAWKIMVEVFIQNLKVYSWEITSPLIAMAYVPDYKYDIFISYAHLDNQRPEEDEKEWVNTFHQRLVWRLGERTGNLGKIKIWWDDKKLSGATMFDESIAEGVNQSALMISLVSKFYLESDYCKKELSMFSEKALKEPGGLQVGKEARMIPVLLQNIPFQEWPSHFAGRSGYFFCLRNDDSKLGSLMKWGTPEYKTEMNKLCDVVCDMLDEMKKQQESKQTGNVPATPIEEKDDRFAIYFADVTDSLLTQRKRTIAELEKKGFRILTASSSNDMKAFTAGVKAAMTNADLSVHLLDMYPGREVEADTITWYPKLEAELALQTDKPMMVWTPVFPLEDVEEENYKQFLADLDNGKVSSDKAELVRAERSMITQHVADLAETLKEKKRAQQIQKRSASEERVQVLIDTNIEDQLNAWDLGKALLENGIQPVVSPGEKDPVQNINLLGDRMSQVKKMVFYYGMADKEWIKQRISAAVHMAMSKDIQIDDMFVFVAPPDKNPHEVVPKFIKVNLINSSSKPKESAIDELLKQLKGETV